jgi:hypothetical protein
MARKRNRKQAGAEKFEEMALQLKEEYEARGIHLADEILRPQGADKLSERIRLIIQPYAMETSDYSFYNALVGIACFAWNTSLRDEEEYPFLVDEFLEETADKTADRKTIAELKQLIHLLILRKLELFPEDERFINNYQVENTASHFHIRIASVIRKPLGSVKE